MGAVKLATRSVAKPWGRRDLPTAFGPTGDEPIGEIWFEDQTGGAELLVKYLFTSQKLSIQVHPGDEAARAAGYPFGKDEAWVILQAEPDATIGIGFERLTTHDDLRGAALDGSIEAMVDWKAAAAGHHYYSPAGTIHAIGPGLQLIEVQQNVDVTYRLYDYGRPRELHLDEGISVCHPGPYVSPCTAYEAAAGRRVLADGQAFVLERWSFRGAGTLSGRSWIIPIADTGEIDGEPLLAGTVWLVDGDGCAINLREGADLLVAYPGSVVRENALS